jgi:RHS repeat-associated protein
MGRLTQEAYDSPSSGADYVHTYAFDDAGNRESWLKDTDPAFGTTGTGFLTFDVQSFAEEVTVTYAYDDNDRLLTETLDAPGAADDRHTVYDWDGGDSTMQLGRVVYDTLDDTGDVVEDVEQSYSARGRLGGFEIDSDGAGSSSAAETTTAYSYDDSGFRIRQSTMHDSTTVVTEFVADANTPTGFTQTIEEHVDGEVLRSYTFGLDEIAQAVKENPAASAVVSQFLHDGRGSVRQLADALAELVQAATKDAAAVLKLDYSAYGTAVNYAAETVATALLHNGEFVDPVSGQQYLRARWYDQATGRFNRVDPRDGAEWLPSTLHRYSYATNDPNTHADPSGEMPPIMVVALGIIAPGGSGALGGVLGGLLPFIPIIGIAMLATVAVTLALVTAATHSSDSGFPYKMRVQLQENSGVRGSSGQTISVPIFRERPISVLVVRTGLFELHGLALAAPWFSASKYSASLHGAVVAMSKRLGRYPMLGGVSHGGNIERVLFGGSKTQPKYRLDVENLLGRNLQT